MKAAELRRRTPLSDLTNISSSSSSFDKPVTKCNNNNSNYSRSSTSTTIDLNVSDQNSAYYSRKHTPREKGKNKRKTLSKLSTIPEQGEGVEDLDLPQAKQSRVPSRKKQRAASYKQNKSSMDAQLQNFIEKQNTYFKEIDEFILSEEEVETHDDLD